MTLNKSSKLLDFWLQASEELNLEIVENYNLTLANGTEIQSLLLIRGYGAQKGMLVLDKSIDASIRDELASNGYGYSRMYEPLKQEQFKVETFSSILEDWGKVKR